MIAYQVERTTTIEFNDKSGTYDITASLYFANRDDAVEEFNSMKNSLVDSSDDSCSQEGKLLVIGLNKNIEYVVLWLRPIEIN